LSNAGPHGPNAGPHWPLVSVVMIFKDAEPFFAESVQSVLNQTWPAIELLLVDDGGTDGSSDTARQFVMVDPDRVRVLNHPGRANRGTGPSRLLGIQEAKGEFVAFLDADDVWGHGHVAHDVALLCAHPEAGMVLGRSRVWHTWDGAGSVDRLNPLPFAPGVVVPPLRLLAAVLRNGALATPQCSLLVRRELLQAVGPHVALFNSTYEDQVINTLLQLRASAVISGATDAWYRQHEGSLTASTLRSGHDAVRGPSRARREFVAWLTSLPELASEHVDDNLSALLAAEVRQQQESIVLWRLHRAAQGFLLRTPALVQRAMRVVLRRVHGPEVQVAQITTSFLRAWGEDLRGSVAGVGDVTLDALEHVGSAVEEFHSLRGGESIADHMAALAVDCLVVTGTLRPTEVTSIARLASTSLNPGGCLLMAVMWERDLIELKKYLSLPFTEDCLDIHEHRLSRDCPFRLVTVRGLRPA
jgi:Glycosyl transferase family 2